jgi:aspartate-semialdehyde dehydrogenase
MPTMTGSRLNAIEQGGSTHRPSIAIVGATGAVGRELLSILEQRDVPFGELRLLASARSAGQSVTVRGDRITIQEMTDESFHGIDIAIFCAGGTVSRYGAPIAAAAGAIVIDNSSAFRMDPTVPLVVPEINGDLVDELREQCGQWPSSANATPRAGAIIANPNCSTILALMAVTPLHRAPESGGIERMVVSTYQAASGAGAAWMNELEQQARDFAAGRPLTMRVLDRQYLFNVFSHNSPIGPEGYNEEEMKLLRETHKIWNDDRVRITATCVRVPVLRAHCESINLTFRDRLTEHEARQALLAAPGVVVIDDRDENQFPEPIDASGKDEVLVGRIRADISQPPGKGLDLFIAGDQLRKGAALNAIQIAERLMAAESAVGRG